MSSRGAVRPVRFEAADPPACADLAAAVSRPGWATDFPQPGDALIAGAYLDAPPPTMTAPWGVWLIISEDTVAGTICLKHPPDEEGAVEIGYGVCPSHRRRGLATAAANWAASVARAAGALTLIADTDRANAGSIGVLTAAGFERDREDGDTIWWRRPLA